MNDKQKQALTDLVNANEEMQGPRVIIDYAIMLACEFDDSANAGLNNEMTTFVERIYDSKQD